jgi:amino acid transporter
VDGRSLDGSGRAPGSVASATVIGSGRAGLTRSLGLWAAIGLSLSLVAPSQAVNINPQPAVPFVGAAIPTAFLLSFVAVLLVAYAVTRLCQRISGSGSLSTLVAQSLNPHAGAVTGWLLCASYMLFVAFQAITCSIFLSALLKGLGWIHSESNGVVFIVALGLAIFGTIVASMRVRRAIRVLMSFEIVTICLIVVVMAVVAVTVIFSHGPQGQQFTWSVFKPSGSGGLGEAAVFGFLSFAGFEGAAALGEETTNPRRDIPFAITGTVVFAGIFFVAVIAFEVMGFGTGKAGLHAFSSSGALVGSLAQIYASNWIANLIRLGVVVGAFSALSGNILASSRVLFAVTRHGYPQLPTAHLQTREELPVAGNLVAGSVTVVFILVWWLALGQAPEDTFAAAGTAGTLLILAAYLLTSAGAARQVANRVEASVPRWQTIIPIAAIVVLGYVFYKNVDPWPSGSEGWAVIVAGALAVLAVFTSLRPPARFSRFLGVEGAIETGLE